MRHQRWIVGSVGFTGLVLSTALSILGCSDDRTTTGTLVERTPEQKAAEKASMEGMKKAMMQKQGQGKGKTR